MVILQTPETLYAEVGSTAADNKPTAVSGMADTVYATVDYTTRPHENEQSDSD